jgi:hypothetical protein
MSRNVACAVLTALMLGASPARGQTVSMTRPDVQLGAGFDGAWAAFPVADDSRRLTYREWLDFRVSGHLMHRKFITFSLGLRPTKQQSRWSGPFESTGGGWDHVNLGFQLLPSRPISLRGSATRKSGSRHGPFGTENESAISSWRSRLSYRNRYLPLELSFSRQSQDETWLGGPQQTSLQRAHTVQAVGFSARSSKTQLELKTTSYDDRITDGDFTAYDASFNHRLRWGKGSRLVTSVQYLDRHGNSPYERFAWQEAVRLQHTWTISSDYRYGISSQATAAGSSRSNFGDGALTFLVLPNLRAVARVMSQSDRHEGSRQSMFRVGPSLSYSLPLPVGGRLATNVSLEYERFRSEPTDDGLVTVLNELHVLGASGSFTLNHAYVEPGAIVVTNGDETLIYASDVDYRLVQAGPLAELFVLPAGRIQTGDSVLVDYAYRLGPEGSSGGLSGAYGVSVDVAGLTLYHSGAVRSASENSVSNLVFLGRNDFTTGFRFRKTFPAGMVVFLGEHRLLRSDRLDVTGYRFRGAYSWTPLFNLRASLGATVNLSRSERALNVISADCGVEWLPMQRLRVRGRLATWGSSWTQVGEVDVGSSDRVVGGSLETEWRAGLTSMQFMYNRNWWTAGFVHSEHRLSLRATRSF